MKHVFNGLFAAASILCMGLLTIAADSPRIGRFDKSFTAAITFPTAGFYYSAGVWNRGFPGATGERAGCGNSAGDICGTAVAADGSIAKVEVSLKKDSGASAKYWDGFEFSSSVEVFNTADGTSSWNLNFGFEQFPAGNYTLHVRATGSAGESESGAIRIFSVSPDYTVIPVISSMEVIGKGSHPDSRKVPTTTDLKVFDKSELRLGDDGEIEAMSYARIWERTAGSMKLVPSTSQLMNAEESVMNCEESETRVCEVKIQYGNVDAYFYEIMVPSNSSANRAAFGMSGDYLIVGKNVICLNGNESYDAGADGRCTASGGTPTEVYSGANIYSAYAGTLLSEKHLKVAVDGNGKLHPMRSRLIEGTPLVVSVPAYTVFTGATELIPIVYESIDRDWQAKINSVPPDGFFVDKSFLELQGGNGETEIVQIEVTGADAGVSTTALTHTITFQGKSIDVQMYLENNRQKTFRPAAR